MGGVLQQNREELLLGGLWECREFGKRISDCFLHKLFVRGALAEKLGKERSGGLAWAADIQVGEGGSLASVEEVGDTEHRSLAQLRARAFDRL